LHDLDEDQLVKDIDQATADLATADKELQDAQEEFDRYAGLDLDNPDRVAARDALDIAQAKYDEALIRKTELENRTARLETSLALAKHRWDEAIRVRQQRQDGPDKEQLALAEARRAAAQANLEAAQAALERLELVSPYDGVVVRLDISAGESALPNQSLMVIADLGQWYVETTDLTENEVVDLQVGQQVTLVPDALPDLELTGTVERIGQVFSEKSGDIVYPVRIRLERGDEHLRWGMTVEVRWGP
jgi:multidrug resistance efflux pump